MTLVHCIGTTISSQVFLPFEINLVPNLISNKQVGTITFDIYRKLFRAIK